MRLIGLHARLHAGKDTAFDFIERYAADHDQLALRNAFADPLKISGMRALGFEYDDGTQVQVANDIKETGRVSVTWLDSDGTLRSNTITGRQLWQLYGTEAHRVDDLGASFGRDFWVDNLLPTGSDTSKALTRAPNGEVSRYQPAWWNNFIDSEVADIAVVTDVRFPNEAQRVFKLGGEVWKIDADLRLGPNTDAHASEQPLADEFVTRTIDNNTTIGNFEAGIYRALNS